MTWPTHQTGGIVAALALSLSLPSIIGAFLGSILPDVIDQTVSRLAPGKRVRQKVFNKIHRGQSHWLGWWMLLFFLPLTVSLPVLARDVLAGIALGGLSHVVLDMLTPRGVPLLPVRQAVNLSIPVCSTGKFSEYVFLAFLICAGLFCVFSFTPVQGGITARLRMSL